MVEASPHVDTQTPALMLLGNAIRRFNGIGEDKGKLITTNLRPGMINVSEPVQFSYGLSVISGRDPGGPTFDLQTYNLTAEWASEEHELLLTRIREMGLRAELARRGILTISQLSIIDHLPVFHLGPSWEAMVAIIGHQFPDRRFVPKIP